MVCLVNKESVDRIIYSIFQRFNLEWKTRTLSSPIIFHWMILIFHRRLWISVFMPLSLCIV